jgi:hypothetical protein
MQHYPRLNIIFDEYIILKVEISISMDSIMILPPSGTVGVCRVRVCMGNGRVLLLSLCRVAKKIKLTEDNPKILSSLKRPSSL